MLRLSFAARIGLIVVVGIGTAWLVAVTAYYLRRTPDGGAWPPPSQLAALASLLEYTGPADRPLVLQAVTTGNFAATLEPRSDIAPSAAAPRVQDAAEIAGYAAALGGRAVSVTTARGGRRLTPLSRVAATEILFRIALSTGGTLVVATRSTLLVGPFGFPAGFGAGLLGSVVALLALYVMHRETRPLARLAAAVDRIDLDGAPAMLPQARRSAPEIQALIAAFNRLQDRLTQLLRARMAMLGGISHDVRTFATRLRLRVELIPEGIERDRAVADIADIIRLLDDGLLATRAGAGELAEELVEFDDILRAEIADRRTQGGDIALTAAPAAPATVLGDRLALRRIVANLVDNALKYGHAARIALAAGYGDVVLTIDDDGPGIPPEQRDAVLEPFVRLEASRNRRTGGAGLGLAVTRTLVEAHGGAITIGDAPGGGTRVTVRLTRFDAAAPAAPG